MGGSLTQAAQVVSEHEAAVAEAQTWCTCRPGRNGCPEGRTFQGDFPIHRMDFSVSAALLARTEALEAQCSRSSGRR